MKCQLCGNDKFKRIENREFAMCTVCGSLERHRLIYDLFPVIRDTRKTVLHIYPWRCWDKFFAKHEYYTVSRHDLTDTVFRDDMFDIVIASHVMEHIFDDVKALSECYRILKPGGVAILPVPICDKDIDLPIDASMGTKISVTGNRDHLHAYTVEGYMAKMASAGFDAFVDTTEEPIIWGRK